MRSRRGFTLRDLLVAAAIMAVLLALLVRGVIGARDAARRNSCVCHGKQIGLGLHNFHDIHKRLPNVTTTRIRGVRPGCALPADDAPPAGYSWQVQVLPYMEEMQLYNAIATASDDFKRAAFDSSQTPPAGITSPAHFAQMPMDAWRCPAYTGPRVADAPEYQPLSGVAINNYVGFLATDLDRVMDPHDETAVNGCLVPAPQVVTFQDITDGLSRTFMFCETRESRYSSWYDGSVVWTVGANPNATPPHLDEEQRIIASAGTALNLAAGSEPSQSFLTPPRHGSITTDWRWGPSSEHTGGAISHGMADGSVRMLTSDIDPTLYLRLISRAGGEKAELPD